VPDRPGIPSILPTFITTVGSPCVEAQVSWIAGSIRHIILSLPTLTHIFPWTINARHRTFSFFDLASASERGLYSVC